MWKKTMRRVLFGSSGPFDAETVRLACRKAGLVAEVFRVPIGHDEILPSEEGYDAILGRAHDTLAIVRSRDSLSVAVAVESGSATEAGIREEVVIIVASAPESREPVVVEIARPVSETEETEERGRIASIVRVATRYVGRSSEESADRDGTLVRAVAEAIGSAVGARSEDGP